MRTRKEIEEGEIVIDSRGHPYQKESFEYRTLEVLLDIREMLEPLYLKELSRQYEKASKLPPNQ